MEPPATDSEQVAHISVDVAAGVTAKMVIEALDGAAKLVAEIEAERNEAQAKLDAIEAMASIICCDDCWAELMAALRIGGQA